MGSSVVVSCGSKKSIISVTINKAAIYSSPQTPTTNNISHKAVAVDVMQAIKFVEANAYSSIYIAYVHSQHGVRFVDWLRSLKISAIKLNQYSEHNIISYKFCDQFVKPRQDYSSYFKATFNLLVGGYGNT